MSTGIMTDYGEEYVQRVIGNDLSLVTSWSVGLYDDSTDSLSDDSDESDITTEPSGSAYSRQTISLPDDVSFGLNDSNNVYIEADDQTFDVSDSSQSVDSYFIVVSFQSSVVGSETGDNPHLLFNGSLNDTLDLSSWAEFTARNIRGVLD